MHNHAVKPSVVLNHSNECKVIADSVQEFAFGANRKS
jgi:hypothetical protein